MSEDKRQEIKDRIAAGEARNSERVGNGAGQTVGLDGVSHAEVGHPRDESEGGVLGFVKEHPLTTIAGGIAMGMLIAGMFPSARNAARRTGAKASALSVAGSHALLGALQQVFDTAELAGRTGSERLEDMGDVLGDSARGARRGARYWSDRSGDDARIAARDTGKTIGRSFARLWR